MKLIVGLGNPGEQYFGTRHNFGFMVVEELEKKLESRMQNSELRWEHSDKFKADILKINPELILIKPTTYMNLSGMAVSALRNFYKVDPKDIIVIHDELDLLLGHLKVRLGGGAGGHHGIENIIDSLGTDEFVRVRLGIGTDKSFSGEHKRISFNAESFVTEPFLPQEHPKLKSVVKKAIQAVEAVLEEGVEKAQNQFN